MASGVEFGRQREPPPALGESRPVQPVRAECNSHADGVGEATDDGKVVERRPEVSEVGIEVRGTAATLALSSVCALDLEAMPSGSATRTILDKAQAVLIKHAPDHYRIEVWQSFAGHLWTLLAAVNREISLDI